MNLAKRVEFQMFLAGLFVAVAGAFASRWATDRVELTALSVGTGLLVAMAGFLFPLRNEIEARFAEVQESVRSAYGMVGELRDSLNGAGSPVEDVLRNLLGTSEEVGRIGRRMDVVVDRLPRMSEREEVCIAMFDYLLMYSPLFVAEREGYFGDEGLRVRFQSCGGDLAVANAVITGAADFGVCDPCVCLRDSGSGADHERLRILAPVVQRPSVVPMTHGPRNVAARIERPLEVDRFLIATYPPPSTTYVLACELRSRIEERGRGVQRAPVVELCTVEPSAAQFQSPEHLRRVLMRQYDVMLLWQPHLEWVRSGSGNFEPLPPEMWSSPSSGESMCSAVVCASGMVKFRPELARRMFRAVSRALMRMHGPGWESVCADAVAAHVAHSHLSSDAVVSILTGMRAEAVFPVVTSLRDIGSSTWRSQLYRAAELRRRHERSAGWPKDHEGMTFVDHQLQSPSQCGRFFVEL